MRLSDESTTKFKIELVNKQIQKIKQTMNTWTKEWNVTALKYEQLKQENEQLQAQVARVREALEEIKDNLHAINCVREMPDKVEMYANEAISIIDEIGGKEDV